ncbi:MAG: hypothetical protein LBH43_14755 [Treponema sp.]|jgi:hypothetical protein|nr:hypothetical protein [Treponema sp.]
MSKNFIPRPHAAFNSWFKNLSQYVSSKALGTGAAWKHVLGDDMEALNSAYSDWYTDYTPTLVSCTQADRKKRDNTRGDAEKIIRPFVKRYLHFPPVTDEDRIKMGIPIHKTRPSPIGHPSVQAEADLTFPGLHLVELVKIRTVGIQQGDSRAIHGVRIHYGVLSSVNARHRISSAPETAEDLPHSFFTRKKKHLWDFEGDSGKKVYISLHYENSKGERGPFGQIMEAAIP